MSLSGLLTVQASLISAEPFKLFALISLYMQATHEQGAQWLGQAVSLLPKESAGEGDKSKLLQVTVEVASRDESKSRLG